MFLSWLGMQSVLVSPMEQAPVLVLILWLECTSVCFAGCGGCGLLRVLFRVLFFLLLIKTEVANLFLFCRKLLKSWWGRVGRGKNMVLKTHNVHGYGFEVAWGTWGLVYLALCPFLQSLLVFLIQCNFVAQFRYIVCQGHCISPKKEFLCLSCCTEN